jgi:CHAT domain-containing protein
MKIVRNTIYTISALMLLGCQSNSSTAPTVSIEEAKKITAKFEAVDTVAPPRTIEDIKAIVPEPIGQIEACEDLREFRADDMAGTLEKLRNAKTDRALYGNAASVVFRASEEFAKGNFKDALDAIEEASGYLPDSGHSVRKIMLWAQISRISAEAGDINRAKLNAAKMRRRWDKMGHYADEHAYQRQVFDALVNGAISAAEGRMGDAERQLSIVAKVGGFQEPYFFTDPDYVRAKYASTLLHQGRLIEAEIAARKAVYGVLTNPNPMLVYTASSARSLTVLAEIFLEMRRPEDAEFMAALAVKMHVEDCSELGSLAYVDARKVLARAMAAQGKWSDVFDIAQQLSTILNSETETIDRFFIGFSEWPIALIKTGNIRRAVEVASAIHARTVLKLRGDSFEAAEALGVLAAAQFAAGDHERALKSFSTASKRLMSEALTSSDGGRVASGQRVKLILEAHFDALITARLSSANVSKIDAETFRLAAVLRGNQVQKALSATALRSKIADPALADLVRRSQDAEVQVASVVSKLSRLNAAPPDQFDLKATRALSERLVKLRAAVRALAKEISDASPEFSSLTASQVPSADNIQSNLMPNEALIATYVREKATYIWVVPTAGPIQFAAADLGAQQLSEIVSTLRQSVDPGAIASLGDIPAFDTRLAYSLYEKLLKPLERGWMGARNLNIVTHGPLGQLPFSMLPTTAVDIKADTKLLFDRYRSVPWLARSHAITVLPSVTTLNILRGAQPKIAKRKSFVGFGDPYFNSSQALQAAKEKPVSVAYSTVRGMPVPLRNGPNTRGINSAELELLPRLPATVSELVSIASSMGSDPKTSVFLGKKANEQSVKSMKLDDVKVLAFATHGLVPGDLNGLTQPALALSSPKVAGVEGDGLLTMGEILGLKLNADWVVLSACNTASGDGAGAEAVSGLGRAFFYAGARSLLVSNWPVHSDATAKLTTTLFYLQAVDEGLSRADALQKTRLELISTAVQRDSNGDSLFSYAHPIFWAPFTIVGDGGGAKVAIN